MKKYDHFEEILTNLSILCYIIYSKVKLGFYYTNKKVEDLYKDLHNKVYGWELKNKNEHLNNYVGIDLACDKNRIAIQVTSQTKAAKVEKTLSLFDTHHLKNYDRVIVFNIVKKSSHSKTFTSKAKFDKKKGYP